MTQSIENLNFSKFNNLDTNDFDYATDVRKARRKTGLKTQRYLFLKHECFK